MKLHEFFLTFFYFGKAKKAPGTFGSLAAIPFWYFIAEYFSKQSATLFTQNIFWMFLLAIAFVYGCWASPIYTKQFDESDHQTIVLDEVVGQILALQFTFNLISQNYFSHKSTIAAHMILCLVLFRFFDIAKPWIIGIADRKFKNGFGVMFDDLLSGLTAALVGSGLIIAFKTFS